MKVWTVQLLFVYEQLKEGKSFRADFQKSPFEDMEEFHNAYRWMTEQMKKRIGPPPVGVEYPIWAWHTRGWKHKKPDLRSSDMRHFTKPHVCIELEIPDEEILLSDFDAWHFVLNDFCYSQCHSLEEYEQLEKQYESLSDAEKKKARMESWNKIFDVTPYENEWNRNGEYIQATFWEIKPEYVVDVRDLRVNNKESIKMAEGI